MDNNCPSVNNKVNDHNGNGQEIVTIEPPKRGRGHPTDYRPEYCEKLLEWFNGQRHERVIKRERIIPQKNGAPAIEREYEGVITRFPTFEGFADSVGVCTATLHLWRKAHPDFLEAYKRARERQKDWLVEIGLRGVVPVAAYIFTAKNVTDMRDTPPEPYDPDAVYLMDPFTDHRALMAGTNGERQPVAIP